LNDCITRRLLGEGWRCVLTLRRSPRRRIMNPQSDAVGQAYRKRIRLNQGGTMKLTSWLYRMARLSRDAEVIASGNPKKMARRLKNKMLGRSIVRRLFKW